MRLGGLQKLTLLDFPEHVACTVFTMGCNFRCPYCHNSSLVLPDRMKGAGEISEEEFFAFLDKRKGLLDGVAITGGEPLIQKDISGFIRKIRAKGYLVKLDTNGSFPEKLREILDEGIVDFVAVDIKSPLEEYKAVCGLADPPVEKLRESIGILREGKIPYEFRTTVIDEIHDEEMMERIGELIEGAPRYFLQQFEDSGELIEEGRFTSPSMEKMERLLEMVRRRVPNAQIRGVDE